MDFDRTSFEGVTQLYTNKDLFFSNYTVPAKFNDSFARDFRRNNVDIGHALELKITVSPSIQCSGVGTQRQDFLFGSFRSYMRTTSVNGTVAGMFAYHALGEIDIELLSTLKHQAYFAMHPGLIDSSGRASSLTHGEANLDFDPAAEFHEYRFDWLPDVGIFFIDGIEKYRMITNVLQWPSRIMFNHWTDGNINFSKGPATEDASLWVKNMTFFFNSSTSGLMGPKCMKTGKTCDIQSKTDCCNDHLMSVLLKYLVYS
jgi:hypothetical protein